MSGNGSHKKLEAGIHRVFARFAFPLAWILVWQLASMMVDSALILAGPLDAVLALVRLAPTPALWAAVARSFALIAAGTVLAYALALGTAFLAWRRPWARALAAPAMTAMKSTPLACIVVLLLIWFGSGQVSLWAVLLMATPAVYFPALKGLDAIDPASAELFSAFDAPHRTRLAALIWPSLRPYLTSASETVLGMAGKAGIAAELIGVPAGTIGERIYQAKLLLETADVFAWTIVVVALFWGFEHIVLVALNASWPRVAQRTARRRGEEATPATKADRERGSLHANGLVIGHADAPVAGPLSLTISAGEALALVGPSGAGKTTLLHTMVGLIPPLAGAVEHTGDIVSGRAAIMFQDARLIDDLDAVENLTLLSGITSDAARRMLDELFVEGTPQGPVNQLSGGQRRRVELARALAAHRSPLILDEPLTGLDAKTRSRALEVIRKHQGTRPLIISTHDVADAYALDARLLDISTLPRNVRDA